MGTHNPLHDLLTSHKALPLNGSAISPVVCKHDTISDLSYLWKLILLLWMWSVWLKIPWEESVFWPGCLINTSKSNWSLVWLKPSAYKFDGFLPDCPTHHWERVKISDYYRLFSCLWPFSAFCFPPFVLRNFCLLHHLWEVASPSLEPWWQPLSWSLLF